MTAPLLWLGLAFGFRHALEADHVAAVASLATRAPLLRHTLRIAIVWGLGHATTILVVGALLFATGLRAPAAVAELLEATAGLLLMALGLDVLWRLRRLPAHPAGHTHGGLPPRRLGRAFVVGGVHGMAGSAALTVAVVPSLPSGVNALAYLALFGLGSIAGMAVCSVAISLPLRAGAGVSMRAMRGSPWLVGAVSVALGCWVALRAAW